MKQVDIYDMVPGNDYLWDVMLTNRDGYPLDLTGKTLTAKLKAFDDSIYEYTVDASNAQMFLSVEGQNLTIEDSLLYITADSTTGLVTVTITSAILSELSKGIYTVQLLVDDEVVALGKFHHTSDAHVSDLPLAELVTIEKEKSTEFADAVADHEDVAANTASRHTATTVETSSTIELNIEDQLIVAEIRADSISKQKLDDTIKTSLDRADSAVQTIPSTDWGSIGGNVSDQLDLQNALDTKANIEDLEVILDSDDVNLDQLQEIVDYIKTNRGDLDSLAIASIIGLQAALDGKLAVEPDGSVGIGGTPDAGIALHVKDTAPKFLVECTASGGEWVRFSSGTLGSAMKFSNTGSFSIAPVASKTDTTIAKEFYMDGATGNIGVGEDNPSEKLDVVGNIKASGTVTPAHEDYSANWATKESVPTKKAIHAAIRRCGFAAKTSQVTVPAANWTTAPFSEQLDDTDSAWDGTTFTVPAGKGGMYDLAAMFTFNNSVQDGSIYIVGIKINGGSGVDYLFGRGSAGATAYQGVGGNIRIPLSAGDTIVMRVYCANATAGASNAGYQTFSAYRMID